MYILRQFGKLVLGITASLLIVVSTNMNAYDARDLIYILIQCADKSLSISGTL